LRGILDKNPGVKRFTVERILSSIGADHVEASLMMFSLPAIVPVSSAGGAAPMGVMGFRLFTGKRQVRLPRFILKKSISRKALAVAIHAALPILEAAEKALRPRWSWVGHASLRRAIGLFVFVLALALAYPLFGFNALHATSIFVMALGMAEKDGLAVLVGAAVGLLSLALLLTSGLSARALRAKAGKWIRKMGRKLGIDALASFLRSRGHKWLARLLKFQWSKLFLLWDPEEARAGRGPTASPPALATSAPAVHGLAELRVNGVRALA
jgi:hypothetical protein